MLLSSDSGKKPHRYSQVVGLLAAGPRPPSPRLLAVSTACQLPLAGEAGRTSETRSTGTSALPYIGGHQISPGLGTPVTRRPPGHTRPVHSRRAVLPSEHVLTLVVSSSSVWGHVTRATAAFRRQPSGTCACRRPPYVAWQAALQLGLPGHVSTAVDHTDLSAIARAIASHTFAEKGVFDAYRRSWDPCPTPACCPGSGAGYSPVPLAAA